MGEPVLSWRRQDRPRYPRGVPGVALARLAREAQVAAQVSHENLVGIVDVDVSEAGALYIVMELVLGVPLHDLSTRFGDARWARGVLRQVASGLAALHARGVVHRDLKPGNVLVTKDGVAKISDFGIARLGAEDSTTDPLAPTIATTPDEAAIAATVAKTPDLALTGTGVLMGTPLYMAPELSRGAKAAGASSDMWSFGVIAHEILMRSLPFTTPPVLDALAGRAIVRAQLSVPELPEGAREILARCLAVDPAARPLASDVERALGDS